MLISHATKCSGAGLVVICLFYQHLCGLRLQTLKDAVRVSLRLDRSDVRTDVLFDFTACYQYFFPILFSG